MLAIIKIVNGVKKIIPLTADIGAGNPVGTVIVVCSNQIPSNYLPLGTQFDTSLYPVLYALLGTDTTPTASALGLQTLTSGQYAIKATSGLPENQQDNVLATINENNSYSTTEHATGKKTTDGKDIYSRTFIYRNVTLSTTGTTLENNFPISFINVTKYEGYACRNSSPLSFPVQPYISGTSLVCIQSITSTAVDKVEITIEYTKD